MKRRGIVFKLFVANLVFYILFFSAIMVGHFWFFERFYEHERAADLEKKLSAFASDYSEQRWPAEKTPSVIGSFITQNHVQMVILNQEGQIHYNNPFRMVLFTDTGEHVSIPVSFFSDIAALDRYNIQPGDHISVQGEYYMEQDRPLFSPYVIRKFSNPAIGSFPNNASSTNIQEITGIVESVLLPAPGAWNTREGIMAAALKAWFPLPAHDQERADRGEAFHFEWEEPISGVHTIVFVQPISGNGQVTEYVFALTPLTQLAEAFNALELYYAGFSIAGGLLLIVILSFLFSKLVARPLLKLNHNASQMAKLDFSAIAPIKSNDELGNLSDSLVSLASNLDQALKELRLTNEKLKKEMAYKTKIQQLQKRFVSDASHELKTPISIVKGYAEGLLDHIAEDKRERYTLTILKEADRMEKLVMDMLELTRLEAGAVPLHKEIFSIRQLAAQSAETIKPLAAAKQMRIQITGAEHVYAWADPSKIEQVLLNYLSNAIGNGNEGTIIYIHMDIMQANQKIRIAVMNEGPRIPANELMLIWDRFYREEDARSRKAGGTGLGLSIVKEIIQLHDQSYGVQNTKSGVEFYFTLELAKPDELPEGRDM